MFRFFSLLIFIVVALAFAGCYKSKQEISALSGTYSGTFYYRNQSFTSSYPQFGPVTITFLKNNYTCTSNSNRVAAGGSGTYKISGQQAQFKDINIWTANFDWGLILNGDYSYQIKSDSLILYKTSVITT